MAAPPAWAQNLTPGEPGYLTHTFIWENDLPGTDEHYTNGLRYTRAISAPPLWVHRMRHNPFWKALAFGAKPCRVSGETGCHHVRTGFVFGQNMYTPQNITTRAPQPQDRPYGAALYYGRTFELSEGRWQHELEYDLGLTGPLALGESVQVGWHDLFNFSVPSGWHNQLRSGPLVQAIVRSHVQLTEVELAPRTTADVLPRLHLVAGTPFTNARAGVMLRIGRNVPRTVTNQEINPHIAVAPLAQALAVASLTTDSTSAAAGAASDMPAADPADPLPGNRDARRAIVNGWKLQGVAQQQAAERPRDRPAPLYVFLAADVTGVAHNALLQGVPLRGDNPTTPPMERVFTEVPRYRPDSPFTCSRRT